MNRRIASAVFIVFIAEVPNSALSQNVAESCPVLGPKAAIGAAGGAAIGGAIGAMAMKKNRGLGALFGGAAGGIVGGAIGRSLDQQDCQQAQLALQQLRTAQTGQSVQWNDPSTGNHGSFTALSDETRAADGRFCRNYQRDYTDNGQAVAGGQGVVCRTADGNYQPVS